MFANSVPVFCYHSISDVDGHSPELFAAHLDAIKDMGFRTISARELMEIVRGERPLHGKCAVLTFDDGHLSNWLHAVPLLAERDMTGVFFAVTDFITPGEKRTLDTAPELESMPDSFKRALRDSDYSQFMNEAELKSVVNDHGMEVYSHGSRHQGCLRTLKPRKPHWSAWGIYPDYRPELPMFEEGSAYVYNGFWPFENEEGQGYRLRSDREREEFCRADFSRSMERIREINGDIPQLFCWPWGQFDKVSESFLKQAGFQGAFTLQRSPNCKGTDPFRIRRIGVGKNKSADWVRSRLRMYSCRATASIFCKLHRKSPEVKKVLYVTDSDKVSGGSRQMINNAKAMLDLGLDVHAVLKPGSALRGELEPLGVRVDEFDEIKKPGPAGNFLLKIARERNIDVIHAFHKGYKGAVRARLLGRLKGLSFKAFFNRGVIFAPNLLAGIWSRVLDGAICNSMKCAQVLSKYFVPKSRLNVVYNSFPAPKEWREPGRKRGVRVLYVGNEAKFKGFDLFLDMAQELCAKGARDMEFVACGTKTRKGYEDSRSPELLNRINFTGPLPHDEVLEHFRASDILVISSRLESMPNTLLEAFAHGLPVVCAEVGGIPELVRDGVNGFLCAVEDSSCMAGKVRLLAEDYDLRLKMGRINRRLVLEFMSNRTKGRELYRVYSGERRFEKLPVEDVAS